MTFLNDLWKKYKSENITPEKESNDEVVSEIVEKEDGKKSNLENMKNILEAFEQTEIETLQQETVHANLRALKTLVDQPKETKEEKLDLRFTKINQHLSEPENHETVRKERWDENIRCPKCQSNNLKRLPQTPPQSWHNHRYRCLECGTIFNDDSGTPMESGIPPLSVWMQCWYLMGCTDSLNYIAAKLGLEIGVIEFMSQQLQKIFNAKKPLTRFLGYDEWSKQSLHLRDQLKEDLMKQYELLNANVATVPKDTAEFRKQQNLRRDLKPSTAPPSGGKKR